MAADITLDELDVWDRVELHITSDSRPGVVFTEDSNIHLGNIKEEAVGESVEFLIIGIGKFAVGLCLERQYIGENYSPWDSLPGIGESGDRVPSPNDAGDNEWEQRKESTMSDLPDRM
ncbi:hypothetical protein [Haloarcula argentinensis]|uniref:Uncharacterized protein n=1 Tax=Haloarcula argentinensis TaxID=43776 RepID=A0A830FWY3_HALAR|nr:hypothetical protein [Haloarcula argentinensis]GGM50522.1 hypothetical protein GCM10009006_34570 [Haloarcula argentinensis]